MQKITFKNGKTINYEFFERTTPFYMGAQREGVKCTLDANEISLTELNDILNNEKTVEEFIVEGEDGTEEIKTGYVIKKEISIKNECVQSETPITPAVYMDILTFELCQRTYTETVLANLGIK